MKTLHKLGFSFVEVGTITPEEEQFISKNDLLRYKTINKGKKNYSKKKCLMSNKL